MHKIFINHRRDDEGIAALWLARRLGQRFEGDVFIDVEEIKPGEAYAKRIPERIKQCEVLLAVIGKQWAQLRLPDGQRRIDAAEDLVRRELEIGLETAKTIVPVLVNGAHQLQLLSLPESLRPLQEMNAVPLSIERFDADFARLEGFIASELARQRELRLQVAPASYTQSLGADVQIGDDQLALIHSCWRRPDLDARFGGIPMYQIHIMVVGNRTALDRIEKVEYWLDPTYPTSHRVETEVRENFGFYELANGHSIVTAAVHWKSATAPLKLNRFVNMTESGPRLKEMFQ